LTSRIGRLRNALRPLFPPLFVLAKGLGLLYSPRSYLRSSGYLQSVKTNRPCRKDGTPIPWMNYHVIAFVEERLRREHLLFEFGSGNSTRFFAELVGRVVSVECDPEWYGRISADIPSNVKLVLCTPFDEQKYLQVLRDQQAKFDVIVIDAKAREACLAEARAWLTDRGVVLLDDAARVAYQPAIGAMLARGFRKLDFEGLKPGGIRAYRTTIFYRSNNALGI